MKGIFFVLIFTAMTFIAWGAYGPTLHQGSLALQHDSLRAFVGVGLAYFLIAVLIPLFLIRTVKESGAWTFAGVLYSIIAGAVGAVGALGIILALGYGGKAVFVMPVVFGCAPVVNTLVAATIGRTFNQIRPVFIAGIITVALGAAGVFIFRSPSTSASAQAVDVSRVSQISSTGDSGLAADGQDDSDIPETSLNSENVPPQAQDAQVGQEANSDSVQPSLETVSENGNASRNTLQIVASMLIAALCWGSYGPMLHLGQSKMAGSRLRPFVCVGIAYFLIAVIIPLMLIYGRAQDTGAWTAGGMSWSFLAGVAGAVGALGVILAFNAGGKPHYVMPLIFGFAPVINTFISLSESGTWHLVQPLFWVSLAVVISGAVTVLMTAPKAHPPQKSSDGAAKSNA